MGLGWINPLFLAGAMLLALPVLIHMVQKRNADAVSFPSLMFLRRIPLQQKRRLVIRQWLLLLLRCLLLLLLVLAFARPFIDQPGASVAAGPKRSDNVILLDRSYSMGIADHWRQAQQAALDFIGETGAEDRYGVIFFDDETEVASDLSADIPALRELIENAQPGFRGSGLRVAIEQADRLLAGSSAVRKRILLISDFRVDPGRAGRPRLGDDIELITHEVRVTEIANSGISGFDIGASSRGAADEFRLELELFNDAASAVEPWLSVEINGREVERRQLRLEPGSAVSETIDGLTVAAEVARGRARLGDDPASLDNEIGFVFSSRQRIPVLIIEPEDARSNQSLYLENAMRLSTAPAFRLRRAGWDELDGAQLQDWAVILVNDAPLPGGARAVALRRFVEGGGGLLVAVGEKLAGSWPGGADGFMPGSLQRRVDASPGRDFRIVEQLGRDGGGGLDLSAASVFSYRQVEPRQGDRVVARYSDGAAFLLEREVGAGKVRVLTTTLDPHWNNLPLQPLFLPFIHRNLNYLSTYESYPQSLAVGEVVDVVRYARALAGNDAVIAAAQNESLTIEPPQGGEFRLERDQPWLRLSRPGFYQVHRVAPVDVEVVLAANVDPLETRLPKLDLDRFVEEIRASSLPLADNRLSWRRQEQQEQQQQLWYAILSLALTLMLLEAFAANWIAVRRDRAS